MKDKGLSHERLAEKLDVTRTLVSHWVNNRNVPSIEKLIRLCEILDVSSDYLLGISDDPKRK